MVILRARIFGKFGYGKRSPPSVYRLWEKEIYVCFVDPVFVLKRKEDGSSICAKKMTHSKHSKMTFKIKGQQKRGPKFR
jgi:hypothetical protein